MDSPAGDYIGAGQNHYYTAADGTFSASKNFDNGVSVSFNGSGHNWNLDFVAAGDAPLAPGTYSGAARYPFQSSNQPGLSVSGDGRGCNELSGSFTINEIVYGADTTVVRFDASFSESCEESMPPLTGRCFSIRRAPCRPGTGSSAN